MYINFLNKIFFLYLHHLRRGDIASPLFFYRKIMNIEQKVSELVEQKIADRPDLFLVDVKMHSNGKLIILMDGDQGIGIADCAAISRHVGFHLEEENTIEHAYNLEVSSPGIDTPLTLKRQYEKNAGRTVGIKLADASKREGKLLQVSEEGITIEEKTKPVRATGEEKGKKSGQIESFIPFDQITETKVLISFK